MNEREWLNSTTPGPMLHYLRRRTSQRKLLMTGLAEGVALGWAGYQLLSLEVVWLGNGRHPGQVVSGPSLKRIPINPQARSPDLEVVLDALAWTDHSGKQARRPFDWEG